MHGVLLDNIENQLRSTVQFVDGERIEFKTWRLFNTGDPLDVVINPDEELPLMIASGSSETAWEDRFEHGQVRLKINSGSLEEWPLHSDDFIAPVEKLSFEKSRILAYEDHGWWTLICWFPLGFALLATQRYYKTPWYLMHHCHNLLGLFVTGITLMSSLQVFAHVNWKMMKNPHSILGVIALALTLFVGITGMVTSGMMHFYTGDKDWNERDKVHKVKKAHRYSSYAMLLLGNGVCSGGIATYFSKIGYGKWGTFGVCTSIFFLLMVAIHECLKRKYNRK